MSRISRILGPALTGGILALVASVTVAQFFFASGESMEPTASAHATLFVDAIGPELGGYHRGDVVLARTPSWVFNQPANIGKRIIGLPGETVTIADGHVLIDGGVLDEPYLAPGTVTAPRGGWSGVIPAGSVFLMGDHREVSLDSRSFGPLPVDLLVGRVWLIVDAAGPHAPAPGVPTLAASVSAELGALRNSFQFAWPGTHPTEQMIGGLLHPGH